MVLLPLFTAGLNKGEARNALARAVFFNRLGEIRDRSFENQRHRASGLSLVVAAITLWNTVYLERATEQMAKSRQFDPALLQHISPLGWEHINLTGDYTWHTNKRVAKGWLQLSPKPQKPLWRALAYINFPFLRCPDVVHQILVYDRDPNFCGAASRKMDSDLVED
jgi:hypothetical protein